jgi:Flp pilus assembly protein TadD
MQRPPRDVGTVGPGAAPADPADVRNWEEVEDAVEALHDGQPIEAIVALRAVLKTNPRNPYAFHYLGVALFETSELEAARDAYRAAVALAPQYLGARVHLSHVLRMLRDVRGAVEQGEIAKRQAPNDPEVWHALGMAHAQRGDKEMARHMLEAYLRSNPEFEVGMEVRAILHQLGPAPEPSDEDE